MPLPLIKKAAIVLFLPQGGHYNDALYFTH
jgi:hypothetical protein